jgi:hypothetical protein
MPTSPHVGPMDRSYSTHGRVLGFLVLLVVALGGCATTQEGGVRADPNRLTQAEIQASGAGNLLEVVQRLRPRWLEDRVMRSTRGSGRILVYDGQAQLGDISVLRHLPLSAARSMRYLDAATASSTLPGIGSGHVAGAIVITSD